MKFPSAAKLVTTSVICTATLADARSATEGQSMEVARAEKCTTPNGSFEINQFMLYPENVDFDFKSCLLYLG
jgi:hypothetical protein